MTKQTELQPKDLSASITRDQVREMRAWLNECFDYGVNDLDIDEDSTTIINGVEYHYQGGVKQFLRDGE